MSPNIKMRVVPTGSVVDFGAGDQGRAMSMLRLVLLVIFAWLGRPAVAQEWAVAPDDVVIDAPHAPIPDDFVTIDGIAARVHGGADERELLVALARQAAQRLPVLADSLGVPIGGPIEVFVARTNAEFASMQPGVPPHWAGGTAWPRQGWIYLRSPRAAGPEGLRIGQVLDHELVHVLIGRALGDRTPPTWLQEGLARELAGEVGPEEGVVLARGLGAGVLPSLDGLVRGFPADAGRARLAYAASGHLVGWIRGEHGDEAIRTTLREIAGGSSSSAALLAATGSDLAALEAEWHRSLDVPGAPRWLAVVGSGDLAWGIAGVLGLVAVVTARRRLKHRMRRLAEREALVDALVASTLRRSAPPEA